MGYALVLNHDTDEWHVYDAKTFETNTTSNKLLRTLNKIFNTNKKYTKIIEDSSKCSLVSKPNLSFDVIKVCKIVIDEESSTPNDEDFTFNKNVKYYQNKNNCLYFKDITDIRMFIGIYGNKKICGRCMATLYSDENIK